MNDIKWINIDQPQGDTWVLPIWGAVNSAGFKHNKELSEWGVHISTRLNFLPVIWDRIEKESNEIYKLVSKHTDDHISTKSKEGSTFEIDDNLKNKFLVDIDSFIFELNSVCKLMTKFFEGLHVLAGEEIPKKTTTRKAIQYMLDQSKSDTSWFENLCRERNFFIYGGAPYLAVEISRNSEAYEILFLKDNTDCFVGSNHFVKLSEIIQIWNGYKISKKEIQKDLMELFRN